MGVTIEQYRARIGVHNINVRVKQNSTHHEACINSRSTMLMLFQLFIRIVILIVFIRIFYLCMLCLPLKRLSEPYKNFSQVVLPFTQKSCYNIYVPLLLRLANDVEENPGPTVYHVVDPNKTISADFSQGNGRKFGQNAGKQCVAMSLTAIVHSHITNINSWDFSFLNFILDAGNNLYTCISSSINKNFLLLTDVPEMVSVSDKIYHLQYSDSFNGDLFRSVALPYYSLQNALNHLFLSSQINYRCCLLTIDCNTVAIFKTAEENFKIFDPHSRDSYGMPHPSGKCVLISVESINNLVIYFQNAVPPATERPFEVKGVTVQLTNSEIQSTTTNQVVKQKQSVETGSKKQTRSENSRNYQKRKLVEETEKQARLANARQNKKKKCSGNSITSQQEYLKEFDIGKNGHIHEQSWAKSNIAKFHKSAEYSIIQCTICQEAWPLKYKPRSLDNYVCLRCSKDKKSPKKFSVENLMIPSSVPHELQDLTQVEEMLIARALPIMRVYIKPGGQRGYSGHCINLPQNVKELATSLPRYPKELAVIVVKVKGKDNTFKDVTVRREKVHNALLWLIHNNPYYAEIEINAEALNSLPENGVAPDLMTIGTEAEIVTDDSAMPDMGPPTDGASEDVVYSESTEMSSFLPVGEQQE